MHPIQLFVSYGATLEQIHPILHADSSQSLRSSAPNESLARHPSSKRALGLGARDVIFSKCLSDCLGRLEQSSKLALKDGGDRRWFLDVNGPIVYTLLYLISIANGIFCQIPSWILYPIRLFVCRYQPNRLDIQERPKAVHFVGPARSSVYQSWKNFS
jgi:hypothetical protein